MAVITAFTTTAKAAGIYPARQGVSAIISVCAREDRQRSPLSALGNSPNGDDDAHRLCILPALATTTNNPATIIIRRWFWRSRARIYECDYKNTRCVQQLDGYLFFVYDVAHGSGKLEAHCWAWSEPVFRTIRKHRHWPGITPKRLG